MKGNADKNFPESRIRSQKRKRGHKPALASNFQYFQEERMKIKEKITEIIQKEFIYESPE